MSASPRRVVLAASASESCEYLRSTWRQMLLATLPAKYARLLGVDWSTQVDVAADGQASYVPHGLRVVESLLLQRIAASDIAVCYPDQLDRFVGDDTRVVGIHAHNPLGITFAADVYSHLAGSAAEPINAAEFKRLILHPRLRARRPHMKIIVGGPGAWQIEKMGLQDEWGIDTIVHGEAEDVVGDLFDAALRGESLPRRVECGSPRLDRIPRIHHRSTFGAVEITRGCGRGCRFCSIALRRGKSFPLEHIVENVRTQVAEGADTILFVTEDLFLYEQGPLFDTNVPALKRLFEAVAAVPGVRYVSLTHGTMAPVLVKPTMAEELAPIAVGRSVHQHRASTHPDKRYQTLFIGIETGSPRLFAEHMKGKAYPFRPEQWPDVVLRGMEILNKSNWFPFCTWILGLPGETDDDTKRSLDLLHALKGAKWSVVPTLFAPLEDTRLESAEGKRLVTMSDLQWEFFFTCWRYNLDFFRNDIRTQWSFNLGIPLYYYGMGRQRFGDGIKYPLWRLAHVPERLLRRKLYLDLDQEPAMRVPDLVPIPQQRLRIAIPETEGLLH
ncbi:MAG: radical SAM protein [Vicinamibacterales bacterium]